MSSLKDLAQECGVSVATVSKALNGQPDISEAPAPVSGRRPAGWAMYQTWRPAP